MTLENKARELGRMLGQSAEYQAVKRASETLNGDKEAVTLLQEMERVRQDAQVLLDGGDRPTPEMEQQLDALLGKVQTNTNYQRLVSAQTHFDKMMYQVNQWILDGMHKGATSSIITLG